MKRIILITLLAVAFNATVPEANAWFGNGERDRRIAAEQKLIQQEHITRSFEALAFVFGIGCVVTLVAGTIIGSRARRHAERDSN